MAQQCMLATKFFGQVSCGEDELVCFPAGVPGFETSQTFVLVDEPSARPLVFLQSVTDRQLCFAAMPIQKLAPDYQIKLGPEDAVHLGVDAFDGQLPAAEFLQLALVALEDEPTANLLAPIVIHVGHRRGVQSIQWDSPWSTRTPLLPQAEPVQNGQEA